MGMDAQFWIDGLFGSAIFEVAFLYSFCYLLIQDCVEVISCLRCR